MAHSITRRSFIKNSTALGIGSFMAGTFAPLMGSAAEDKIDISAIQGTNYFDNTVKAVEMLGGMNQFVSRGSRVALLINTAFRYPGTIVNPTISLAVVKMCVDAGAKEIITIPGASKRYWGRATQADKYKDVIASLQPAGSYTNVEIPKGISLKKAEVVKSLLDCDVFIDIPISKDHTGTGFTGNLKNFMGACPYSTNRFFHHGSNAKGAYDDVGFLSQCIADVNLVRKPDLCVVDATEFVTTNGPFGPGKLKKLDKVVAGTDRVAVDTYCCRFLGLEGSKVAMIQKAFEHGLGEIDLTMLTVKELKM